MWLRALSISLGLCLAAASPAAASEEVWIELETPARVEGPVRLVELAGQAGVGADGRHDVVVCIDVSASTAMASGVDVDEDGELGRASRTHPSRDPLRRANPRRLSSDPDDTILAAEIRATARLLEQLDPSRTRVGLLAFSSDARLIAPVGASPAELQAALRRLGRGRMAVGATNMAAALTRAGAALSEALPIAGAEPQRWVVMLSDGIPTEPAPAARAAAYALEAATALSAQGTRIEAFALGPEPTEDSRVYADLAQASGGRLVSLETPGDIVLVLPQVRLSRVLSVGVANLSSGSSGRAVRLFPDGSFDAVVPLRAGRNRISISARSETGRQHVEERLIHFEHRSVQDEAEARAVDELLERLRERTLETELATRASSPELQGRDVEFRAGDRPPNGTLHTTH